MGCTPTITLSGITYNCDDIAVGGLKTIYYCLKTHLGNGYTEDTDGNITDIDFTTATSTKELEFNNKDGFSQFSEEKTVEANGVVNSIPTVTVEFPRMTSAKRLELDNITRAGLELLVFVETAAGTYHAIGIDYGAYASLVSGTTGTGRSEKNIYQLTITGEEDSLSRTMSSAAWSDVVASTIET